MVSLTSNIVSPICKTILQVCKIIDPTCEIIFPVIKIVSPTCKIILLVNLMLHQISKMMPQPCKTALRCFAAAFAARKSFLRGARQRPQLAEMISLI
jgi:hypothetical protein